MAAQASLAYQDPEGSDRDLSLDPAVETTIGRHPQCTLSINQPSVSRRHARLWLEGGRWYVEDLSSSNGTYVNNRRIGERQELTEGDKLRCGDFQMNYLVEEHTREVGQIPSASVTKMAAPPPRVVGSLSARKPPTPDPEAASRLTVGVLGPSDQKSLDAQPPTPRENVELTEATAELASLKRQLEESHATVKRIEVENRDLKSQCSTLTRNLASAEKANQTAALEQQLEEERHRIAELKDENETLREALVAAESVTGEANSIRDGHADSMEAVAEVYRDLDELTSDLRLKLKLASGLIDDLKPLVQALEAVRDETLPPSIADVVRDAVDGADAKATMKAAVETFGQAERSARLLRRMIRLLRDALREGGWEDSPR